MSTKACKIKLCNCMGMVMDTEIGSRYPNWLAGTENGLLGIIENLDDETEKKFFHLIDNVVERADNKNEDNIKAFIVAVKDLNKFGMEIGNKS